ncbi:MAG: MarC family protein, partial [bacterium]
MDRLYFLVSIFFTLLGPIKVIPAFAKVTQGQSRSQKHKTALLAVIFSALVCCYLVISAEHQTRKFHISPDAVRITAGIVLFLSGLRVIFDKNQPLEIDENHRFPLQLAV